jgi:hypothetical protein
VIVNWAPLERTLRRPILGRLLTLIGSVIFGALMGFAGAVLSDLLVGLSANQFRFAVGGFAVMGFCYGIALIARR